MIVLTANFNCDPIATTLRFWLDRLGWDDGVELAPYNQVFQQLADPSSAMLSGRSRANVVLIRHEDWLRFVDGSQRVTRAADVLTARTRELIERLHGAAELSPAPLIVVVCPPSPGFAGDPATSTVVEAIDRELEQALAGRPGVQLVSGRALADTYRCETISDPHADALGHVPFTADYFAVLATGIARRIHSLRTPPRKVIVLDCDNTLWRGVLGEDGPDGVAIEAGHRALQEFVVAQQQRGVLVCLCSMNNEADVWELFDTRADMVLGRDHVVAWRINWQPKSTNLAELAAELDLGADSFAFFDDDSLHCAEVRSHMPQVTTIQVPLDHADIPPLLDHLWMFDRHTVTDEDRERTRLYRVARERDQARLSSSSLGEFLAGLELRVAIDPAAEPDLPRLAQLTQRTNQFNLTTVRLTEPELRAVLADPGRICLAVRVSDRFGNYGLVGMVLAHAAGHRLDVDSFLLSCRVLGRGVEHRVAARLGALAIDRRLPVVRFRFRPTARNVPARDFVEAAFADHRRDGDGDVDFDVPASAAARLELRADALASPPPTFEDRPAPAPVLAADPSALAAAIAVVRTGRDVIDAMARGGGAVEPGGELSDRTEIALARIIGEQLAVDHVGRDADFYELGGDSLKALQVLAKIRESLGVELPLDVLFEPQLSVASLASWINR